MGAQRPSVRSSDTFILIAMSFALFTDTFVYGMVYLPPLYLFNAIALTAQIVPILPYMLLDSGQVANNNGIRAFTLIEKVIN